MNADEFVSAIQEIALERAVRSAESNLQRPPGRTPMPGLVELANWFGSLTPDEKALLHRSLRLAAAQSVTAFLSVLDGARAIESGPGKGHFALYYIKGSEWELLNDESSAPLNDRLIINDI